MISSGAVGKSRLTSWAPVPNKLTVSVDVKQHSTNHGLFVAFLPHLSAAYFSFFVGGVFFCLFFSTTLHNVIKSSLHRHKNNR